MSRLRREQLCKVGSFSRRLIRTQWQGLVRLDFPVLLDGLSWAAAPENPQINFDPSTGVQGSSRTQTPDFVTRLRYETDQDQLPNNIR